MITRRKFVHKPMVKFLGASPIFFFFFFGGGGGKFLKILMVSDKTTDKAFRIHKTLQTKPIRPIYIFFFFIFTKTILSL